MSGWLLLFWQAAGLVVGWRSAHLSSLDSFACRLHISIFSRNKYTTTTTPSLQPTQRQKKRQSPADDTVDFVEGRRIMGPKSVLCYLYAHSFEVLVTTTTTTTTHGGAAAVDGWMADGVVKEKAKKKKKKSECLNELIETKPMWNR